ncbi:nose resistant to fluoxetine protein 6 [Ixodes scapularis]
MRLGICIPSACSADDLQRMATQDAAFPIGENLMRPHPGQANQPEKIYNYRHSRARRVTEHFFGVLAQRFRILLRPIQALPQNVTTLVLACWRLARLIVSFSVVRNTRLLFAGAERPEGPLDALNGIRVVSCFWIVLGHIYFLTDLSSYIRFSSLTKLQVLFRDFLFTVVENFTLPVDTFFFITGLLLVYNQRKKCSKKQTISFWDTVRMVTHRYWRMTPPFALTMALFVLVPTLGSGPMWWEVLGTPSENCRLHWWSNLLYFSNYMSYTKMCMLHSWFLSLNMQYFIIGIPLTLMLFRNPGATSVVILALTLACSAATSTVAYLNNLPPTMLMMTSDWSKAKQNLNMVYYQPFTHFGPFAVGLCLGYILSVKKAPRFGTATLVAGWLTSLSMLGASLFAPYPFRKGDAFSPVFSAVYAGCHRTLWTLGVAWLTLLCSSNQAGLVGSALSSSSLTPLSRLSYLTYLLHPIPIYVHVASTKEAFQLDHYYMCTLYLGILTTSIILAYLAYVTVELPFASLEAILTSSPAETSKPALPLSLCKEELKRNGAAASRGPALSAPTQAKLNESSRL